MTAAVIVLLRHLMCRLNMKSTVTPKTSIQEETFIFAQNNEMFVKVNLDDQLNDDTDAGSFSTVLSDLISFVSLFVSWCQNCSKYS